MSVLRRLQFAANFYPRSMPNYWERLVSFSVKSREDRNSLTPEQACQFIQNIQVIDSEALLTDAELTNEITEMERHGSDVPLGMVFVSEKLSCLNCGSKLYIRRDRASNVVVYDDNLGTMPGTHYTKYCRKTNCSFQQHYGYCTYGNTSEVHYDPDWSTLPYFLSTRETAISMDMLRRLDKEILIGQISYKQRADIYNDVHGYISKTEDVRLVPSYTCNCIFLISTC